MKTSSLTEKFASLKIRATRVPSSEEVDLYLCRARLAAAEERFDVARVFCEKAREIEPENLEVLFFLARVLDVGFSDMDEAIALYQRIIARAGYDGSNPYCAAAREAVADLASAAAHQS
jgi:tetratricopeptide (TPR) repeat protein